MKRIPLLFIVICLCSSTTLLAQQTKTQPADVKKEIEKPAEAKAPPAPVLAPAAVSPDVTEKEKVVVLKYDPSQRDKNLTPEQKKILNGEKTKPNEPVVLTPNTSLPAPPVQVLKPAAVQQ